MIEKVVKLIIRQSKFMLTGRPYHMNYPFASVCNHSCIMCNFHLRKNNKPLDLGILKNKLKGSLFSDIKGISLSGGEPFTVANIEEYFSVLLDSLKSLKTVNVNSNGSLPERIKHKLPLLIDMCEKRGVTLSFVLSMDGIGDVHNFSRGKKNAWTNIQKSLEVIQSFGIPVNILMTIHKHNCQDLLNVYHYCHREGIKAFFGIGVVIDRLNNRSIANKFEMGEEEKKYVWQFLYNLSNDRAYTLTQRMWYRVLSRQIITDGIRKTNCIARNTSIYMSDNGKLSYCAVYDKPIEDFHAGNDLRNYKDRRNKTKIKNKMFEEHCKSCMHCYQYIPRVKDVIDEVVNFYSLKLINRIAKSYVELLFSKAKSKTYNSKHALLFGCFGSETIGDKAILSEIVDNLKSKDYESFDVLTSNHHYTKTTVEELAIDNVTVIEDEEFWKNICKYNLIVFSGGPIMGIKAVLFYSNIVKKAISLKVPVVVWGAGLGPFGGGVRQNLYRKSALSFLSKSSVVAFRDTRSRYDYISETGAKNSFVVPEPGYVWAAKKLQATPSLSGPPVLGVSFRGWPQVGKRNEVIDKKIDIYSTFIDKFIVKYSGRVVLIPMNTFYNGGDDRLALSKIYDAVERKDCVTLNSGFYTPHQVLGMVHECSCFVGMRFHSVAFSTASCVPTVAIDYISTVGKISSYFKDINMEEYLLPISEIDDVSLMCKIDTLMESWAEISASLQQTRMKKLSQYEEFTNKYIK